MPQHRLVLLGALAMTQKATYCGIREAEVLIKPLGLWPCKGYEVPLCPNIIMPSVFLYWKRNYGLR